MPLPDDIIAYAVYVDGEYTKSNFGQLDVVTNPKFDDLTAAYGAGIVESVLTPVRTY